MEILDTDSYKASHFLQYPKGTEALFGYLESRGGMYRETMFFGLGSLLSELTIPVKEWQVREAADFMARHGEPFPFDGWMRIVNKHKGFLPLRIRAVREGSVVPVSNPLLTVETTDPEIPWIMGWLETQLMRLWYPITVATRSYMCKKVIYEFLQETSNDPLGELPFKLHDFGSRGVSSRESAGIGGAAHLVNFRGTDTIWGCRHVKEHYLLDDQNDPVGFSIPASEHSTITAWGKDQEVQAYRNMLGLGKMVSVVSDSYDIFNAVENLWCDTLLDEVKASGTTVVIRPDSGNPVDVNLKIAEIIDRKVGCTKNLKGYKVFPKFFRLIQGDGNNDEQDIKKILTAFKQAGFSASNIAFGMGGGLLQKLDRDTQKFAFKVSSAKVDGEWRDVYKDPITDPGKRSKRGRVDLIKNLNGYRTIQGVDKDSPFSELLTVYDNGVAFMENFDEIRRRADKEFLND